MAQPWPVAVQPLGWPFAQPVQPTGSRGRCGAQPLAGSQWPWQPLGLAVQPVAVAAPRFGRAASGRGSPSVGRAASGRGSPSVGRAAVAGAQPFDGRCSRFDAGSRCAAAWPVGRFRYPVAPLAQTLLRERSRRLVRDAGSQWPWPVGRCSPSVRVRLDANRGRAQPP